MEKLPSKFERGTETEISPEFLKKVEKSKLIIDDKVNLLLTKAGLKPASEINLIIKSEYENKITEHMSEEDIQKVLNIIKESHLPFQLKEKEIIKESYRTKKEPKIEKFYQREQMKILIGHSKDDLDFLIKALESKLDELFGKAFGFPATAIEAYMGKREKLDFSILPKEIRESNAMLFSSPTLSRDNWQEEIKQGQQHADFIKKISSRIYEEMKAMALRRVSEVDTKENF